jgi:hypothetical protein
VFGCIWVCFGVLGFFWAFLFVQFGGVLWVWVPVLGVCVVAGRVFDTKKHSNVKHRAEYRRIGKYYKSLEKAKAEKARRRRVIDLRDQGCTFKEVAGQLGVSVRTVKRDLDRLEPYLRIKRSQLIQHDNAEFIKELGEMSLKRQLEVLRRYRRITRPRTCKDGYLTISLDPVVVGRYKLKFRPNPPVNFVENGKITIELENGELRRTVAQIYLERSPTGHICLQIRAVN